MTSHNHASGLDMLLKITYLAITLLIITHLLPFINAIADINGPASGRRIGRKLENNALNFPKTWLM
jgi:hypothetical protein